METTTLAIEYHTETPEFTDDLRERVEKRLLRLTKGKRSLDRAVVNIQNNSGDTVPQEYRVRIAVYDHALNAAATETNASILAAVNEALDAVERQIRAQRNKRRSIRRREGSKMKRQNGEP